MEKKYGYGRRVFNDFTREYVKDYKGFVYAEDYFDAMIKFGQAMKDECWACKHVTVGTLYGDYIELDEYDTKDDHFHLYECLDSGICSIDFDNSYWSHNEWWELFDEPI